MTYNIYIYVGVLRPAYAKLEPIIRRRTESVVADAAADEQLALASCLFLQRLPCYFCSKNKPMN